VVNRRRTGQQPRPVLEWNVKFLRVKPGTGPLLEFLHIDALNFIECSDDFLRLQ
jgi:hypothetical protein